MPIFAEAVAIVKSTEVHLVAETNSKFNFISYLKRLIWLPVKFLQMGVSEKTKSASVWAFLSFASMILGAWLVKNLGIEKTEAANIVMLASMITPMFLVIFALPSMYGDSGVSEKTVRFVVEHLHARGFSCVKDIELLKKSVKQFEDRARSRVTALKWLTGLLWAGFMYSISKGVSASTLTPSSYMSYAFMSALIFMGVIIAYLLVWGYEASLDKLFRAIEFGCNDFCHLIELSPPENNLDISIESIQHAG